MKNTFSVNYVGVRREFPLSPSGFDQAVDFIHVNRSLGLDMRYRALLRIGTDLSDRLWFHFTIKQLPVIYVLNFDEYYGKEGSYRAVREALDFALSKLETYELQQQQSELMGRMGGA